MVRIIIERHCQPGKEMELEPLYLGLRAGAMRQHGYISGETLKSVSDPSFCLVISTWVDAESWKIWETSTQRREIVSRIELLLAIPEKISVFSFAL